MSETTLTLVQLNDSHGYLELHDELFYRGNQEVYQKDNHLPQGFQF